MYNILWGLRSLKLKRERERERQKGRSCWVSLSFLRRWGWGGLVWMALTTLIASGFYCFFFFFGLEFVMRKKKK